MLCRVQVNSEQVTNAAFKCFIHTLENSSLESDIGANTAPVSHSGITALRFLKAEWELTRKHMFAPTAPLQLQDPEDGVSERLPGVLAALLRRLQAVWYERWGRPFQCCPGQDQLSHNSPAAVANVRY